MGVKKPAKPKKQKSSGAAKNTAVKSKNQKPASAARRPARDMHFNPADMRDTLQEGFAGTVDPNSAVFLVGIMQYVATELLEISANAARSRTGHRHTVMTDADVRKAVQDDKGFRATFNQVYREALDRGELKMTSTTEE